MKAIFNDKSSKKEISVETSTVIFIIAAVSLFVLSNFIVGYSLLIFLFVVAFGFALSIVFPRSGFYAIVFLTVVFERFFTLVPIYWNRAECKIYPLDILFVGVILGMIYQLIKNGLPRKLKTADYLVAIFILASGAYFLVSAFFLHTDGAIAFSTFKNYSFYGLFYFAVVFLFDSKEKLLKLIKFFLAGAAVAAIFVFIGIIRGEGLWTQFTPLSTPGTRILAFPHAFFFTMAILVSLAWIAYRKDSYSTFFKIMIPIWAIGVAGSLMRHLWISLFVSVLFLFFLLPKESKKVLKNIFFHGALVAAILLVLTAYISFLFPQASISKVFNGVLGVAGQRFVSMAKVNSDESLNWRKSVWQATWKDFQHSLAFGLGYGKKISVEIGLKYKDFVEVRNIHNSLLTIFIQMGLWSVALVAAMFWLLFKSAYSTLRKSGKESGDAAFLQLVFLALFVNYLAAFLFQTYLETNLLGIFFWIILGGLSVLNVNSEI
ncbi:MAG: O-antigen ligase family protein [Candidatus Moraniibacteriota bacterium]